ncbi:hypothetical protein [Rheinheimera baltica]|uniref:hypothetical protein n=1 Tax=Rheinheimera baltica TaxID=67576 RepID=UPI0027401F38|nr:hypothetical protein [Rheinheimera baltica]MDP5148955.1 hypothetical protein [Rheinheimera baltica]
MDLTVSWWMYLLNTFTPVMVLMMLLQLRPPQQTETQPAVGNAAEPFSPWVSVIAGLLSQVILAAILYAFWLGAHWLVFWMLSKPLYITAYFYKPAVLAYWFPYLFGLFFISYSVYLQPKLRSTQIKAGIKTLNYVGCVASVYMVFVTYLKWLNL